MTVILGIDQALGTASCAFAVVDDGGLLHTYTLTYSGIKTGQNRQRCKAFAYTLREVLLGYEIEYIVTEMVRSYQHNYAVVPLSMLQGALSVTVPSHIPIYLAGTSSWQSEVLHPPKYKKSEKRPDMKALSVAHVLEKYGIEVSHHISDAINLTEFLRLKEFKAAKGRLELA